MIAMTKEYEMGRFIHLPNRYVVCFQLSLSPKTLNEPGVLRRLMEFFMERDISIVHFKLSRPEPGKAIDVSIFADMTNSRDKIRELKEEFDKLDFIEDIAIIYPLFNGITLNNAFFPLKFMNERAVILTKTFYKTFIKDMREVMGSAHIVWLYYMGLNTGRSLYKKIVSLVGNDINKQLILARELLQHMGFGIFELETDFEKNKVVIKVKDCIECELFKGVKEPKSQFIRGIIAGFLSSVFRQDMHVEERKCIAMGDKLCVFEVKPREL